VLESHQPPRAAIISVSADGLGRRTPSKNTDELRVAAGAAGCDDSHDNNHSLALRVILRPQPVDCYFPVALADADYSEIVESQFRNKINPDFKGELTKNPAILKARAFGLARRNLIQWGEKLLIRSARMVLEPGKDQIEEPNSSNMRVYHKDAIVHLSGGTTYSTLGWTDSLLLPTVQARLLFRIKDLASRDRASLRSFTNHQLINFNSLVDPRGQYISPTKRSSADRNQDGRKFGAFIPSGNTIFGLAILAQNPSSNLNDQDEWRCSPVVIPSFQRGKNDPTAVVISATKHGGSLDAVSVRRFTIALEHVFAHVALLLHVRRFVEDWWSPLLSAANWDDKRQAAVNFIRAWQRHAVEIDSKWALGADDPTVSPDIVNKIASAINLNSLWSLEVRRVSDLLVLATQILDDGDIAIL